MRRLEKIQRRYDADHDMDPAGPPVTWAEPVFGELTEEEAAELKQDLRRLVSEWHAKKVD